MRCLNLEQRLLHETEAHKTNLPPALKNLNDYLAGSKDGEIEHVLEFTQTGGRLNIDFIARDQKRFLALVTRAVQEDTLTEINAGQVVGPKVFILLNHLMWDAPKSAVSLTIKGSFSRFIFDVAREEHAAGIVEKTEPWKLLLWTQREVNDFNRAVLDLGLLRCKSSKCDFEIRINNGRAAINIIDSGG